MSQSAFKFWGLLLLLLRVSTWSWAQADQSMLKNSSRLPSYVILHDSLFPVHHVQAKCTGEGFIGIAPASLEIFNLMISTDAMNQLKSLPVERKSSYFAIGDTLLIAMSVLPDGKGDIVWEPIALDTVSTGSLLSLTAVVRDGYQRIKAYRKAGNPKNHLLTSRGDLLPMLRRDGRYWIPSSYVLTEYFITDVTHGVDRVGGT